MAIPKLVFIVPYKNRQEDKLHFSVYMKYCAGKEQAEAIQQKIKKAVPEFGNVKILVITDKQFGSIVHLGRHSQRSINTDQLVLF